MKKFLFIIPQSPKSSMTPFRQSLTEISLKSLKNQTSNDWEALLIGEEERTDGNINYISSPYKTKEEKLNYFADWILKQENKPQYIIRFDDDDLISPFILEKVSTMNFDCYADQWHWFYDTSSGNCSRQKRRWLPNTIIHKTEYALTAFGEYNKGITSSGRKPILLQNDHSQTWHQFYSNKKIVFAKKNSPIYMRVLSPSSITAGNATEFDRKNYEKYRKGFGTWDASMPEGFSDYATELKKIWVSHFGKLIYFPIPFKDKLRSNIDKLFS